MFFFFFLKFLIQIQLHLLIALEGDFSCLENQFAPNL
jgi:hypothetical protein